MSLDCKENHITCAKSISAHRTEQRIMLNDMWWPRILTDNIIDVARLEANTTAFTLPPTTEYRRGALVWLLDHYRPGCIVAIDKEGYTVVTEDSSGHAFEVVYDDLRWLRPADDRWM
jgi:isochorismate hydrolase